MSEEEYKDYLAARVLTESKPVTYRLLSRALQVNVNVAKLMLFDFHQKQNARKSKSVHATYLITGTRHITKSTNGVNGEDTAMPSSSFMSTMSDTEDAEEEVPVKKTTILLVREEELEKTRAEFEDETSIHIYSLEPGPIENLNVLSACNHEIATEYLDEDPLARWKTYGTIHNPHVKRRTVKYAPPAAAPAPKTAATPAAKPLAKSIVVAQTKKKEPSAPASKGSVSGDNTSGRSTPQPAPGPSTLRRSDSKSGAKKDTAAGDIFKSFAKAKAKPKEAAKSKESTPAPVEDEPMLGMSEDEGDDDEPEVKVDEEKNEAARKAREERAAKLRKMMEDDDDEMLDAPAADEKDSQATMTDAADTPSQPEVEPAVTVEGGRRRGRRRVTKKKKVKDEDGYLVTKEETVWESFSEDEPEPKKLKPAPSKPAAAAKGKNAGKKGQGSIASFFKKA
ncbi:hypothetical protein P153DRAFT_366912 [Dothidotthia symphoricarpi CBS 119687]|uniref:DNA polymerase delta subunit 3 n=1 Tax=Dothidotthia symphoricarpi CBS 119687 TaxID=1392245 RepID=A0A6A6AF05_9PLEO|nr:uncharacterized protein P153DRAFT_366912 [Dothidotthia symphoricarpi CBS 119687]KAF2129524.1 hypothetical protein P153DRAFT_366912 [Dothidotthia symphoricarpi CBS 119687]